jgi:phosphoglycolate phosphatase
LLRVCVKIPGEVYPKCSDCQGTSTVKNSRLILFDIDGTLLNTRGAGRASTREAMLEVFGTVSTIDQHVFGGKTDWFTLVELLTPHGYNADAIGQRMPHYEQIVARHLLALLERENTISPIPGALETVRALRAQNSTLLGVVTGNVATTAPIKMRFAGFDPAWFPVGAYGSEAVDRNDLPAIALQRAVAHCGESIAPADVVIVGDTPADVECARALGAVAVAVLTGFSTPEALIAAKPDHLIDDLTGLLDVL